MYTFDNNDEGVDMQTESLVSPIEEQRSATDRRTFSWRTLICASFYRRRINDRRTDAGILTSDQLPLASSLLVLTVVLLSLTDAFFTTRLLSNGAVEINPFMDALIRHDTALFIFIKTKLTGLCLIALIALANYRAFGRLETGQIAKLVLVGYLFLIAWELYLLNVVNF